MPDRIFPKINHKAATAEIGKFLKEEFRKRKKTSAIVGVSGGVDSSLTAELCQRAGLDVKRVFMPHGKTSDKPAGLFLKIDITKAADINPIAGLWKTQVFELAKYFNLPIREPSADLWKGQTDEKELEFSYEEADPILYLYCVKKINPKKIIKDFDFSADLVYRVLEIG